MLIIVPRSEETLPDSHLVASPVFHTQVGPQSGRANTIAPERSVIIRDVESSHLILRDPLVVIPTLPHPSCLGLHAVTQRIPSNAPPPKTPSSPKGSPKGPRLTPVPLPPAQEYWREYSRPDFNCYKHGGHYDPGLPRRGGPHDASPEVATHLHRLVLHDVYYWNGEWYQLLRNSEDREETIVVPFAAYFPMVSGNWPQPTVDRITIHKVVRPPWPSGLTPITKRVGYLQPPTDFLSVYHVAVETIFPMFHTLHESALPVGEVAVVTSRPRASVYGFKDNGCTLSFEKCMDTVWGAMYLALTVASNEQARGLLQGSIAPSSLLASCHRNSSNACVYGLLREHQQMHHDIPISRTQPFIPHHDDANLLRFESFYVGNPTHCEPLWGGDPHYAEIVAQRHSIRGNTNEVGRGDGGNHQLADQRSINSSIPMETFISSYMSCQGALRAFRTTFVELASRLTPVALLPLSISTQTPVHIVLTSRKGDWARQLLDEDELVHMLSNHVAARYPRGSTVRAIKFGGSLAEQLDVQLNIASTTIFIGNHGANLLNSIFLRPNSGLITLSLRNPGFYPFSLFPEWLHVRDLVTEQMCNRRLFKGKCRWMEGNNNDMFLNDAQRRLLLTHVDAIVAEQQQRPRS